jgi:hypothetical protein
MAGPTSNQPAVTSAGEWFARQEKRMMREERRPTVRHASDLLGPGIAPHAVRIMDWSGPETEFNGFFYSQPGALHSPDSTLWWIGQSLSQIEGFGIQTVWDYRGTSNPPLQRTRRFTLVGGLRVFGAWG